ncbi:MAG: DUF3658 domain-containing protein [Christensenellales bacterium]|jgi:hypothetical protein
MLEVVFSDSAKAAMQMAKNYNREKMLEGAVGYIGGKPSESELERLFEGKPVGGDAKDVACIGFNLDAGDIGGDIVDGPERRKEFVRIFGSVDFEREEVERFFHLQRKDFEKMLAAAKEGQPIRAWTSSAPFSACAFAFMCDALRDIDCEISVISLPEYGETSDDREQPCSDWAEVPPGRFHRFLPLERKVSGTEKRRQSHLWQSLKDENAPLRAVVNGRLISVPEDFYDHILLKNIPDGEFVMARLIGEILGKYPLGIGDGWYALRIKKMISENRLEMVADMDPSHPYGKILKKPTD